MNKEQAIRLVALAVPKDRAGAEDIAEAAVDKAVIKIGRMRNVDWNRDGITFNLISGQGSYELGKDILDKYKQIWNMQTMWRTDIRTAPITVVGLDEFNAHARGGTQTGSPLIATLHSSTATLDVYPIPDSAYSIWGYVRKEITDFNDIPSIYHDVVVDYGGICVRSMLDPNGGIAIAAEGLNDILNDSRTTWTGNTIGIDNHLGRQDGYNRSDSGNLTGG